MVVDPKTLHLPTQPGVYLFKTDKGRVLYVGKATHLKDRVRSYFAKNPDREMIPTLVAKADLVDCIVTSTPGEALILERQLIREHKPQYNSLLKDDKSYPFIAISTHEFPRILYTRHPPKDAKRWGPFPDAKAAKMVIKLLRRYFGIRDDRDKLPFGYIESEEYSKRVKAVVSILDGDANLLIKNLQKEMDRHSEKFRYEAAARSRDMIAAVQQTLAQQIIHSRFYQECDAIGFANQGDFGTVVLLSTENGSVVGQVQYPLMHRGDISESVSRVLAEHYAQRKPPKTILVPSPVGDWMESWLSERRGSKVEVRNPQRGELTKLRRMADANAEAQLMRNQLKESGSLEQRAADEAAKVLGVSRLNHIVCFDMAQLQGKERVGASVCLRNGRPDKKAYRTYTVKDTAMDDVHMMRHVVERWLKRQEVWPDLLLIDGGVAHLNEIHALLSQHNLVDQVPLAALSKREETIHRIEREDLVLDRNGRALVFARDEAHRFVNNFHRKRRTRKDLEDPLEAIEGLGAKRLQALLRHFGGRRGIDHASPEDLAAVEGIGPALAERIWREIH
ncbi:MAG TPA: excinuclease ABC subunit C [Candidatus Poseidoniales archaeon]|nr:MAG TPA: excinuclease ABC subunit C [Candidatus Poseidoniales archaeon]HIH81254.1 excinuclease ABC subunit C [Candidatus Thalassarchaeaceae archaeon]